MLLIVVGMCKTTKSIDETNRYLYTIFMKKLLPLTCIKCKC